MKIYWKWAAVAVLASVVLNLTLGFMFGPAIATIEAVPGGLLLGIASQWIGQWREEHSNGRSKE